MSTVYIETRVTRRVLIPEVIRGQLGISSMLPGVGGPSFSWPCGLLYFVCTSVLSMFTLLYFSSSSSSVSLFCCIDFVGGGGYISIVTALSLLIFVLVVFK